MTTLLSGVQGNQFKLHSRVSFKYPPPLLGYVARATKSMAIVSMTIGLILLFYLVGKASSNVDPEMSEEQEDARNAGAIKHQGWQTLDLTEPWSR